MGGTSMYASCELATRNDDGDAVISEPRNLLGMAESGFNRRRLEG